MLVALDLLLQLLKALLEPLVLHSEALNLRPQLPHLRIPLTYHPLTSLLYPHYIMIDILYDLFKSPLLLDRSLPLELSLPELSREDPHLLHQVSLVPLTVPQPRILHLQPLHLLLQRLQCLTNRRWINNTTVMLIARLR